MPVAESYQLRHNNHLTIVLEALARDESFMDVTLTAQGRSLKAHKVGREFLAGYYTYYEILKTGIFNSWVLSHHLGVVAPNPPALLFGFFLCLFFKFSSPIFFKTIKISSV